LHARAAVAVAVTGAHPRHAPAARLRRIAGLVDPARCGVRARDRRAPVVVTAWPGEAGPSGGARVPARAGLRRAAVLVRQRGGLVARLVGGTGKPLGAELEGTAVRIGRRIAWLACEIRRARETR